MTFKTRSDRSWPLPMAPALDGGVDEDLKGLWVSAPSNIAWIKYMGKVGGGVGNQPINPSCSWTLPHLRTWAWVTYLPSAAVGASTWVPWHAVGAPAPMPCPVASCQHMNEPSTWSLDPNVATRFDPDHAAWETPALNDAQQGKVLRHVERVRAACGMHGHLRVATASNFPMGVGVASSASSFAALTAAVLAAKFWWEPDEAHAATWTWERQAGLSQAGSGSSCRSLAGPLVHWDAEGVTLMPEGTAPLLEGLQHSLWVVDTQHKTVGSSEAHRRVASSPRLRGRGERAVERMAALREALQTGSWEGAYHVLWSEFQDMHALFETANPPFGYMQAGTVAVLEAVERHWASHGWGPWATLDAGPNVHLFWPGPHARTHHG